MEVAREAIDSARTAADYEDLTRPSSPAVELDDADGGPPPTRYGDLDFPGLVLALRTEEEKQLFGDIVALLIKVLANEKRIATVERSLVDHLGRTSAREIPPPVRRNNHCASASSSFCIIRPHCEDDWGRRRIVSADLPAAAQLPAQPPDTSRSLHSFRERLLGIAPEGAAPDEDAEGRDNGEEAALRQQLLDLREDQSTHLNEVLEHWAALHDGLKAHGAAAAEMRATEQQLRLDCAALRARCHELGGQVSALVQERDDLRAQAAMASRLAESALEMAEDSAASRAALARMARLQQEAAEARAAAAREVERSGTRWSPERLDALLALAARPSAQALAARCFGAWKSYAAAAREAEGTLALSMRKAEGTLARAAFGALRSAAGRSRAERRTAFLEFQLKCMREALAASEARAAASAKELEALQLARRAERPAPAQGTVASTPESRTPEPPLERRTGRARSEAWTPERRSAGRVREAAAGERTPERRGTERTPERRGTERTPERRGTERASLAPAAAPAVERRAAAAAAAGRTPERVRVYVPERHAAPSSAERAGRPQRPRPSYEPPERPRPSCEPPERPRTPEGAREAAPAKRAPEGARALPAPERRVVASEPRPAAPAREERVAPSTESRPRDRDGRGDEGSRLKEYLSARSRLTRLLKVT